MVYLDSARDSCRKAAGFDLAAQSESDAKPKDRNIYLAIGESDRMTLKFVKPAK